MHEPGEAAEEKGRKDRSPQVGRDSLLYRFLRSFRFPGFFRFMVMALSGYFEEPFHLLARGTLDEFNARGSVLMMQDHKRISGKDYRVC